MYINNNGSGYADYIEVAQGTTVAALFDERVPGGNPHDYLIRVNRQPATADQVLCEGDRVSFTPYVAHSIMWRRPCFRRHFRVAPTLCAT
jgi:sulfur carrier protein ThiS